MSDYYHRLEKAELHVHLEGSVEPETILELDPSLTPEFIDAKYRYTDFSGFIQSYVWVNRLLNTPSDYALITRRLLERLWSENVPYVEINLSAGVILWKNQDLDGIFEAVRDEASRSKVEVHWIFDAVRQFGPESAMRVAESAVERVDKGVVGFGIGGDEARGPVTWFQDVFRYAETAGLALIPHAGETVGPESVWDAIRMGARRIGHGISSASDPELMRNLRDNDIPLEVCISSNLCTGAVPSLQVHPVRKMFDQGVPIVLGTDDPAMFQTTLANEYRIAAEHFGFSQEELQALARNSFKYRLSSNPDEPISPVH